MTSERVLELSALLVAIAAGTAAAVQLGRWLWRGIKAGLRRLRQLAEAIDQLVDAIDAIQELVSLAVAVGEAQKRLDRLERRLLRALQLAAKHHPEDAHRYLEGDKP